MLVSQNQKLTNDKNIKFPQTRYFLKKQLKFSCASWSIWLCNTKTRSKVMMTSYHFEPKWENWSGQGFFQKNPKYKGLFYPFHCAKFNAIFCKQSIVKQHIQGCEAQWIFFGKAFKYFIHCFARMKM